MAATDDAFDDRYELRLVTPDLGDDGTPTPETTDIMDAIGIGFHEGLPETELATTMVRNMRADDEVYLAVYRRHPVPGTVDERLPVGTFASFPKQLSWGDGTGVDTFAVSGVTVRPTERRRGILRRMMTSELDRAAAAGYAVASLTASEGTIYRRFGFGCAIRERAVHVRRARALPLLAPTAGSVALVTPAWLADGVAAEVFARFHARTPGSMVRNAGAWRSLLGTHDRDGKPARDTRAAVYRASDDPAAPIDGYVTYKVVEASGQDTRVEVSDLVYATDEAYLGLWEYLLSIDLNDVVQYSRARLDDPIVPALGDNRAFDVEHEEDHVWLRVLDPAAVLTSRPWAADGSVVFVVRDALGHASGAFRLTVLQGRGSVERIGDGPGSVASGDDRHVVDLDVAELGALLIGSVDAGTLAAAGLIRAGDDTVQLLRAVFRPVRTPHGITYF